MPTKTNQPKDTDFVLSGEPVNLPAIASGTAVKNAARRFASVYDLPPGAAAAFAAATVDPAVERGKVATQKSHDHLTLIRTPSDQYLVCHPAQLWSPLVSGDGSNGRSRYSIQTSGNGSARPWPIARHHRPAIVDYHTPSLSDMADAAKKSAEEIRSPKLMTEISRHKRGVWNPPVVVLARAFIRGENGDAEERWFLHSIEGSTRMEACHELTGVDPEAPLVRSDAPLDHMREVRGELVERFNTLPTSPASLAAARAATIPALVVVAVVDEDEEPIVEGFPDVVNAYVESVHVQPRPFSDVAMNNVLGERLLLTLRREGRMDPDTMEELMGRSSAASGKPSVRGATLVHAVCDPANESFVRDIAITEDRVLLTKNRRAELIGPLVVRQFSEAENSAERALMRAFTPDSLIEETWEVSGTDSETLRKRAVTKIEEEKGLDSAVLELIARGGPALCAAGLLLSDQGSTVEGIAALRGNVAKVLEGLVASPGGAHVLADAVAWADGDRQLRPRQRRVDGTVKTDPQGDELHYGKLWSEGNMQIRALALNEGEIPEGGSGADSEGEDELFRTPEEAFRQTEEDMLSHIGAANTKFLDLATMTDEQGRRLIERIGLRPAEIVDSFSRNLSSAYARYGEDPLAGLDEDQLPDAEVSLEAEEEDE